MKGELAWRDCFCDIVWVKLSFSVCIERRRSSVKRAQGNETWRTANIGNNKVRSEGGTPLQKG